MVELFAALTILSIVVLVSFQMTASQVLLGSRAAYAARAAAKTPLGLEMFQHAVGGLVPTWPEESEGHFEGASNAFGGITAKPLHELEPRLRPIAVALESGEGKTRVRYASGAIDWELDVLAGQDSRFSYLGADGKWYGTWPPAANPAPGPYDGATYFETPELPEAIRLTTVEAVWIAPVLARVRLPVRVQDL